jgi:hypothetical protein
MQTQAFARQALKAFSCFLGYSLGSCRKISRMPGRGCVLPSQGISWYPPENCFFRAVPPLTQDR